MYNHLHSLTHKLRHVWQNNSNMSDVDNTFAEQFIMNQCLEADANAMAISALYSYKVDNGWSEPFNYARDTKSDYIQHFVNVFTKDVGINDNIDDNNIDDSKLDATQGAYRVFKGWFDLNYDKDVKYKDHYKQGWAKNFANEDLVKCVAKDVIVVNGETKEVERKPFDINTSTSFADWLKRLTTTSTGEKYTPDNVITSFLNDDKVTGVDEVTYGKLVEKISDYVKEAHNNWNDKTKSDYVEKESLKLPYVYGAQKQTQINKNESINNGTKTQTSLIERHENAKQRITFYQNNKKAKEIKIAIARKNTKGRS